MNLKLRWAFIAVILIWALFSMFPLNEKLKLGLDLQGGMHVVLGVDTEKAVEAKVESIANQLRKELATEKVDFSYVQKTNKSSLTIALKSAEAYQAAQALIEENYPSLQNISISKENTLSFMLDPQSANRVREYAVDQSLEVIRNRIDEFGVSEPVIQRQGKKQVVVQLPGVTDPDRAIDLIGKTAQLKFYIVDDNIDPHQAEAGNLPFDDMVLYQKQTDDATGQILGKVPFVVKKDAVLTGDYLVDAEVNISSTYNLPIVQFKLDAAGSKLFEEITADNIGNRMAIVLDDNVYSAPVIRSRIAGGSAMIDGIGTLEEAKDLAIVLRAGSLPAPVTIEENRTVGPSLGQDSINSGVKAAGIGLLLIIIFMVFYYRVSGLIANIALASNFIIIIGIMSQFEATLTLPGIAGIILTIGMSVDANVLIFERVREEIRMGRTPMNALSYGYEKAFSTIMDANITTIIAAIVLFQFGTGPIKGFAITLSIGILASLFTAIFVTKTVFWTVLGSKETSKLSI